VSHGDAEPARRPRRRARAPSHAAEAHDQSHAAEAHDEPATPACGVAGMGRRDAARVGPPRRRAVSAQAASLSAIALKCAA
jgi:hypothetical protein